jgi:hypothetical protein
MILFSIRNPYINRFTNHFSIHSKEKKLAMSFRYIDDVLSLNNLQFKIYQHQIYPSELEIKETTDTPALASYLDLYLFIDNFGC